MSVLTKSEIALAVSRQLEVSHVMSKELVDSFFEKVKHDLEDGVEIKLSSFGKFITKNKSARPGRNPKTLEAVEIKARRVVVFHVGQKLKNLVKGVNV